MIDRKTIKRALAVDVILSNPMQEAMLKWVQMYENKSPWLGKDVLSLNLAAVIASEIARSVTIEMTVELGSSERAIYLEEQLEKVLNKIREAIEFGAAKGGLMFKPYVNGDEIDVDLIHADQFYPSAFSSSGDIQSCVFVDQRIVGQKYYTRLEYHDVKEDSYTVKNVAYQSEDRETLGREVPLDTIEDWKGLAPEASLENVDKPLFAYFKFPMANNIDPLSPLGVSCYARATDLIQKADEQWTRFIWEFESGERALYVDNLAFSRDDDGNPILPIKKLYRTLETGSAESDLFEDWSPDLRQADLLAGLDAILKKVEFACGLAFGTLSDPQSIDKTATEIKSSKQRSSATVTDTQKSLRKALNQLVYAMDMWATLEGLVAKGTYDPIFTFDDSILIDRDSQLQEDLRLVSSQIMSKVEFRMRNMGEDLETAKKMLDMVSDEQVDMFGEGEGFVPGNGKPNTFGKKEEKKPADKEKEKEKI